MKAELVPTDGGPPIPITRDVTVLGRRDFCDIHIDDPSLSKRHCVLVKTEGLLVVRDLATTNGTKVKGQKIRWAALLPEDRIAFGGVKFRVYLGPDDVLSPSERRAQGLPPASASATVNGSSKKSAPPLPPPPKPRPEPARRPKSDDMPVFTFEGPGWLDGGRDEDEIGEIIDLD